MPEIVSGRVPVLVKVTDKEVDSFTCWLIGKVPLNSTITVIWGSTPFPLRLIEATWALSVEFAIVMLPVRRPVVWGVNVTLILEVAPTGIELGGGAGVGGGKT